MLMNIGFELCLVLWSQKMRREDSLKAGMAKMEEFENLKGMWSCFCIQSKNIMCNNKKVKLTAVAVTTPKLTV
jgi:hypothetical protein